MNLLSLMKSYCIIILLYISFLYYTATGFSIAIISYESTVPEEIGFQKGDRIEIIGYFMKCMQWFVGRHVPSGQVGFVQSSHVSPEGFSTTVTE
ncbi:hypothetical protein JD844_027350 [Phrynosoma platyrhinos]|uniref:SH3 domain-containing protein n=1 Tax=Phrynosoma platyrhinos TaxID=52577 RepID=A0ABQ7SG30_PHRPL|nr:hypothetical protein JD844_027350 [Phrynosoma platyrhinos]